MPLTIAFLNLKPGTGKTTSAVWLAHAFHAAGRSVLLADADPAASALEWSDLLAASDSDDDDSDRPPAKKPGGFEFRIIGMASRELHRRVPEIARPDDVVIVDAPQMEDHAGIARSAMRFADELVIPVAPHGIEINRMAPVLEEIAEMEATRDRPARVSVLLNRVVKSSTVRTETREDLTEDGYQVLATEIPFVNRYSQSFGMPVRSAESSEFAAVAAELDARAGR
ncbi:AAA family ATPase [Actinomadura xylanilytica]|uniref:nucleotide-binding protein n=1 Tax=Actinomadura xylanilytica TaxID=887459 RepID=UPI00255A85B6|nr:AAA family ATPase [Actinomadura xylanilytica]MDL4777876.1 AAA family ATPase [Actinomadura xylanilytica]